MQAPTARQKNSVDYYNFEVEKEVQGQEQTLQRDLPREALKLEATAKRSALTVSNMEALSATLR